MQPPDHQEVMKSLAEQLEWVLDEIDQGNVLADQDARLRLRFVLDELDRATRPESVVPRSPGRGLSDP